MRAVALKLACATVCISHGQRVQSRPTEAQQLWSYVGAEAPDPLKPLSRLLLAFSNPAFAAKVTWNSHGFALKKTNDNMPMPRPAAVLFASASSREASIRVAAPMKTDEAVYLGFDLSTQSCKGVLVTASGKVLTMAKVIFDVELPDYKTQDGVHRDGPHVTSPTTMWAEALELCVRRLAAEGDLSSVTAISGSGQQHGTVYWSPEGIKTLASLNPELSIAEQLKGAFLKDSPVWMDTSCTASCRSMEESVGGALELARRTGSTAYERFSAHLIRQTFEKIPWESCAQISLVSSFGASLLKGAPVPIDYSDGAGMNLMSISDKKWDKDLLDFVGPPCRELLPEPVASWSEVGTPCEFWQKLGIPRSAKLIAWSGDNPCAIVGLGLLSEGDIAISLGTSDTCMAVLPLPSEPAPFGHIFPHPTLEGLYWCMLVYSNGDITRRKVRDDFSKGDWEVFTKALEESQPGNGGCVGYYTTTNEITPAIDLGETVTWRDGKPCTDFTSEQHVRAAIEMRALAMKSHLARLAPGVAKSTGRLLLTGGASANPAIRQVFADVFQRTVSVLETPEAAAVGAAMRAMHADGVLPKVDGEEREKPSSCADGIESAVASFQGLESALLMSRGRK